MNPWLIAFLPMMGAGALCLLYGFFIEPHWIKTRKITITVTRDKPFYGKTVVFFSDIHVGPTTTPKKLERQMRAIMAMKPDAIIFGGDLVEEPTPLRNEHFRLMVQRSVNASSTAREMGHIRQSRCRSSALPHLGNRGT